MAETHLLPYRLYETPTFEDVYLTAQASIQMPLKCVSALKPSHVPCQIPLFPHVLFAALARDFRGLLCWSAMCTVENETPKSEIPASVGLRRRGFS